MSSVSMGTEIVELLLVTEVAVDVFLAIDLVFIVRLDDLVVGLLTFVSTIVSIDFFIIFCIPINIECTIRWGGGGGRYLSVATCTSSAQGGLYLWQV